MNTIMIIRNHQNTKCNIYLKDFHTTVFNQVYRIVILQE